MGTGPPWSGAATPPAAPNPPAPPAWVLLGCASSWGCLRLGRGWVRAMLLWPSSPWSTAAGRLVASGTASAWVLRLLAVAGAGTPFWISWIPAEPAMLVRDPATAGAGRKATAAAGAGAGAAAGPAGPTLVEDGGAGVPHGPGLAPAVSTSACSGLRIGSWASCCCCRCQTPE